VNPTEEQNGIRQYYDAVLEVQKKVLETQYDVMMDVAQKMVKVVQNDGRIFLFGTGHSHMFAEEAFFRAGGLAASVPIFMSNFMLHEHVFLSSRLERTAGIVGPLLEQYDPKEGELLFVISCSGVNHAPIEMALEGKKRGLTTVGICSVEYAKVAPLSQIGKRLFEVVDFTIDNCGVPGDALIQVPDSPVRVAPSSTVVGAMIWNSLITEVVFQLRSVVDPIPVPLSFNVGGAEEHNRKVIEKWAKGNPHINR
jgi:uncharacterized phosphosugar-binding protein